MSDRPLAARSPIPARLRWLLELDRVWLVSAAIVLALLFAAPDQAVQSIGFTLGNLVKIAPFLLLSVGFAAVAAATGADALIGRAFAGSPLAMVLLAALAGALSPFCSCGVIPLLAALLALGAMASATADAAGRRSARGSRWSGASGPTLSGAMPSGGKADRAVSFLPAG